MRIFIDWGAAEAQTGMFVGILSDGRFAVFKTFRELQEENAETASSDGFYKLFAELAN